MSSLLVVFKSLWIELLEHKTELVCFLSIIEGTEVIVNSIDYDVLEAGDERTGALIDGV